MVETPLLLKKRKEKKNTLWDVCLTKLWFYFSYMWWLWCSIIISTELCLYCISFKIIIFNKMRFFLLHFLRNYYFCKMNFFPIFIVSEMHCSVRFHQLGFDCADLHVNLNCATEVSLCFLFYLVTLYLFKTQFCSQSFMEEVELA